MDFTAADLFSYTNIELLSRQIEKREEQTSETKPELSQLEPLEVMQLVEAGKISVDEAEKLLGGY